MKTTHDILLGKRCLGGKGNLLEGAKITKQTINYQKTLEDLQGEMDNSEYMGFLPLI